VNWAIVCVKLIKPLNGGGVNKIMTKGRTKMSVIISFRSEKMSISFHRHCLFVGFSRNEKVETSDKNKKKVETRNGESWKRKRD
jgi:hypothetical protein